MSAPHAQTAAGRAGAGHASLGSSFHGAAPRETASDGADPHSHGDTHGHGSRRSYVMGFLLSVVLTAIPFLLVMGEVLPNRTWTALVIFACALVQIVVHVSYFLHVDSRSEGGWTMISFIFTIVIVAIVLGGSIWIMYHLNTNMMPMMPTGVPGAP